MMQNKECSALHLSLTVGCTDGSGRDYSQMSALSIWEYPKIPHLPMNKTRDDTYTCFFPNCCVCNAECVLGLEIAKHKIDLQFSL